MISNLPKAYRIFTLGGTLLLAACSGSPMKQGLIDGHLAICGDKPNCVSSLDKRDDFHIAPLVVDKADTQNMSVLQKHLQQQDNVEINEITDNYVWAVYTTPLMRFNDDVEFHASEPGIIQVRSASRLGYSDLGANRKRIENLRKNMLLQQEK